jgi:hypothetical protein
MADVATLILEVDGRPVSQAEAALLSLKNASDKTADSADLLASVYGKLAGIISTTVIIDAIKNVAMLGARYEMLGATMTVMANNAGITGDMMQAIQDKMEQTGISALRARQGLQLMAAAQVNLSKAAELGRVAQDGATLAGINSSEAFAKLVQGISTGESRIIRHMGIMVNFKSAINEYARANHVAVESIDAKTLAEIRMDAVLAEGAKRQGVYEAAMTTAGKQMLSMVRYTENLQVRLGETFNPATTEIVFALVGAFKDASEAMKEWRDSGGQATFANNLAEDIKTAINYVETFVGTLAEMKTSLEVLAAGFAAFKVVQWLQSASAAFHKWASGGIDSFRTMTMSQIQYAASAKVAALADHAEVEAEVAAQKGRFLTNDLINRRALANLRVAESDAVLTAAELRLAEAETLRGQAAIMANGALDAAGGPMGLIAIAITGIIFLYQKLKDSTIEEAEAANTSMIAKGKALVEETRNVEKYLNIRAHSKKKLSEDEIKEKMYDPLDTPEVKALDAQIAKIQEKANAEIKAAGLTAEAWYSAEEAQEMMLEGGIVTTKESVTLMEQELSHLKAFREWFLKLQADNKAATDAKQKVMIQDAKDRERDQAVAENKQRQLYFLTQMAAMREKIMDADEKGIGLNKQALEFKKLEAETAKKIVDWTAMYNDVNEKTGKRKLDKAQLDKLKLMQQEEEAKQKASIIRVGGEAADENVYSGMQQMRETSDAYNRSLEETISLEMWRSVNLADGNITESEFLDLIKEKTSLTILAKRRANDESEIYLKTIKDVNEQERLGIISAEKAMKSRFDADNTRSGGRLAANSTPEETYAREVAQLEAYRKNGGDLVTYQRSLIKLKEASGSAWAAMGAAVKGYTDQTSTLLADFFNGTSTNWHKMFSSMVRDMEIAIIKAMIMKPIMDALAASLTSLTKGGGPGFFSTFASYFNGSTPSLTQAPTGVTFPYVPGTLSTSIGPNIGASAAFSGAGAAAGLATAAQPRGTGDVYLSVSVAANGSAQTQESGSNDQSIAMARSLAAKMREVIMDEQRPNGIIYNFVNGR